MTDLIRDIRNANEYIVESSKTDPEVGLILGSGLGELGDEVEDPDGLPYSEIPGFNESTVEGHAGRLVLGSMQGKSVCLMQGRYHFYEGHSLQDIAFPVQVMSSLGIDKILVTNASGAVNEDYQVGELVLLKDHINMMGDNPLIGPNESELGPRFVDMTYAYSPDLRELAHQEADSTDVNLREGVYAATTGPSYETPSEVRMLRTIGADLVGMSTVPEVIAANHCGMDVLGISCVTNMAAGVLDQPLDHEEVIQTTEEAKSRFKPLVKNIINSM